MMPALLFLRAILDPRGRADRFGFLVTGAIGGLFSHGLATFAPQTGAFAPVLYGLAAWVIAVPCQRRLHDLNLSGWLVWAVVPLLFIWSVVASLLVGGVALAMGGETLALLNDGGPLHLALSAMIGVPLLAVAVWLSYARGQAKDNVYGPVPQRYGLSSGHGRHLPTKPADQGVAA